MAEWEAVTINDVVRDIRDQNIVLPVIQRNLVWDEEKMVLLFDSLLKGNSFGGIMALEEDRGTQPLFAFRHFSQDGVLVNSNLPEVLDQSISMIIDGQQRLQSFYMGLMGSTNGKNLYFNLFSQDTDYEFQFASSDRDLTNTRKEDGQERTLLWYPVPKLFSRLSKKANALLVANDIFANRQIVDEELKEIVRSNVFSFDQAIFRSKAIGISKVFVNREKVDIERQRMVELFRRLNDGGTRLSALDLAASVLKGFDYRLESFLRRDIPQFHDIGFGQDEVIKLIFLLQDNQSKEVTDITREDADFAVQNKQRILKSLEVVRQVLKDAGLYEYYRGAGRSVIPLYFIGYHVFHKSVPNETVERLYVNYDANNPEFTNIKAWMYLSLLNGVFSRGKGWIPYRTGVRKILNTVARYKDSLFPAEQIFRMYESHPLDFSREINENQLSHWDRSFVMYLMYGCKNLTGRDIDHIHPKFLLEQEGVDPQKIHSISNYQLLDENTNRGNKRAKRLEEWLKDWNEAELFQYLPRHLIPQDSELWQLENFDRFMAERSELIVEKINEYIPHQTVASPELQAVSNTSKFGLDNLPAGAAQISREIRDPEEWLMGVAERRGNGKEFRRIVEVARELGLYARFQNNWWIVMFTPPTRRDRGLIEFDTYLNCWIHFERLAEYLNCSPELVREQFDIGEVRKSWYGPFVVEDVPEFIKNLKDFFSTNSD